MLPNIMEVLPLYIVTSPNISAVGVWRIQFLKVYEYKPATNLNSMTSELFFLNPEEL